MKKLLIIPMLLIATLFTTMFVNHDVHAVSVGGYLEGTRAVYETTGSTSEYSIYQWQLYSTPNQAYYYNLGMVMAELVGFDSNTRIYSFRSDVLNYVEINYPNYQGYSLPNLQYLVIEDADPSPTATFYDTDGDVIIQFYYHEITNASPSLYPVNIKFEILTYDYEFYNIAYNGGYDTGKADGILEGRNTYGYYDTSTNTWLTGTQARQQGYDIGYDWGYDEGYGDGHGDGFSEGINLSDQESYDKGYIDGSNDSFLASIKDWIVPAIIVVLFLGGAVTIVLRKSEG